MANYKCTSIIRLQEVITLCPTPAVIFVPAQVICLLVDLQGITFAILVKVPRDGRFWVASNITKQLRITTQRFLKNCHISYIFDVWCFQSYENINKY